MDTGTLLHLLRDPAGLPAPPQLFQALMVLTWILHIAFVHLALGAAGLALFAFWRVGRNPHWERLSMAMTKVAKVSVSLLIVLGVAPLLFTQVIYDPQWYASNVLSAQWAIAFILTMIVAYCLWFVFYWSNHEGARRHIGWYAAVALALFMLDGLIMHALSYQALLPDQWMGWYAPNGVVDMSGARLHAIQWPRYLFVMGLAVPAVGAYLMAYAAYYRDRADIPAAYLAFARDLGRRIGGIGFAGAFGLFLLWQLSHPASTGLALHPVGWSLATGLLAMAGWMTFGADRAHGYLSVAGGLAVLAVLSVWREVVRLAYMKPFGYAVADYPMHPDWSSTALFVMTLIAIGGSVGGFYLTLIYRAGRVAGVYTADRTVSRLGTGAIWMLAGWTAVFLLYGVSVWLRNGAHA